MRTLRLAMAQINPTVGDFTGNASLILSYARRAKALEADLVIFPELALTGYPPEDLLLKSGFVEENMDVLNELSEKIKGITAVVGFVDRGEYTYNAAAVIDNGHVAAIYHKMFLPNYGVFDEERYFQAGSSALNFNLGGVTVGVGVCEDIWYPEGPARVQALAGAEVIVNINASPFHMGKACVREEMLATRAIDNGVIIAYNNMVGGQDELVFDGQGMIINERGEVLARGAAFTEDLVVADLNIDAAFTARLHDRRRREERLGEAVQSITEIELKGVKKAGKKKKIAPREVKSLEKCEEVFRALVLGTRDYVRKNCFKHAVIGLSGGIDSALVAALAAEALGSKNITCAFMPSRYTSEESREDAERLAKNLSIDLLTIPIDSTFEGYLKMLGEVFKGKRPDTTEENLQARIRGDILMALSNKFGWLVLTTGNKSEMSVGYATLYGDMAGGFAVIKDLPKTLVYELSSWINTDTGVELIPDRVITKAPSAELKPGQTDQDVLPPYDVLDRILKAYVEEDRSFEEIKGMGFKAGVVRKVMKMVDKSEYKRRQAPPGIKITPRAFGKDRRMPITNGYREGE